MALTPTGSRIAERRRLPIVVAVFAVSITTFVSAHSMAQTVAQPTNQAPDATEVGPGNSDAAVGVGGFRVVVPEVRMKSIVGQSPAPKETKAQPGTEAPQPAPRGPIRRGEPTAKKEEHKRPIRAAPAAPQAPDQLSPADNGPSDVSAKPGQGSLPLKLWYSAPKTPEDVMEARAPKKQMLTRSGPFRMPVPLEARPLQVTTKPNQLACLEAKDVVDSSRWISLSPCRPPERTQSVARETPGAQPEVKPPGPHRQVPDKQPSPQVAAITDRPPKEATKKPPEAISERQTPAVEQSRPAVSPPEHRTQPETAEPTEPEIRRQTIAPPERVKAPAADAPSESDSGTVAPPSPDPKSKSWMASLSGRIGDLFRPVEQTPQASSPSVESPKPMGPPELVAVPTPPGTAVSEQQPSAGAVPAAPTSRPDEPERQPGISPPPEPEKGSRIASLPDQLRGLLRPHREASAPHSVSDEIGGPSAPLKAPASPEAVASEKVEEKPQVVPAPRESVETPAAPTEEPESERQTTPEAKPEGTSWPASLRGKVRDFIFPRRVAALPKATEEKQIRPEMPPEPSGVNTASEKTQPHEAPSHGWPDLRNLPVLPEQQPAAKPEAETPPTPEELPKTASVSPSPTREPEVSQEQARRPEPQVELPASPLAEDAVVSYEVKEYLQATAPILEQVSLLITRAPSLKLEDYDPSDPNFTMVSRDVLMKMDSMKRDLQILDSKAFAIIPPAKYAEFHSTIRESIIHTHQACRAIMNFLNEGELGNLGEMQDHLYRARELIQKARQKAG